MPVNTAFLGIKKPLKKSGIVPETGTYNILKGLLVLLSIITCDSPVTRIAEKVAVAPIINHKNKFCLLTLVLMILPIVDNYL